MFGWLPQLYWVLLRVMNPGKPAVGIRLWVNGDFDASGTKLCRHFVEVSDTKVNHPHLIRITEVFTRHRKRLKGCGACFCLPTGLSSAARN